MRRVVKAAAIAAAVVLLAALGLYLAVDVNSFRGPIQDQLEKSLSRKVSLGEMGLSLLPLAIRVQNLVIGEDPAFAGRAPFLTAEAVYVRASLAALLRKQIRVESVRLRRPAVELIRNARGTWNFSSLGSSSGGGAGGFTLPDLGLDDGALAVTDLQERKPREVYGHIDLSVAQAGEGRPVAANLTLRLPGKLALAAAAQARYDRGASLVWLDSFSVKLGGFETAGKGSVKLAETPARVDIEARIADASAAELARVAAAFGKAFTPDMEVTGRLRGNLRVEGPVSKLAVTGNVNAEKVEIKRKGWKAPVRIPALAIEITPNLVRAGDFVVESGGTRLGAAVSIADYASSARLSARVKTQGAALEELLNVAMAYGAQALEGVRASSGTATLEIQVQGPLRGTLGFSGSAAVDNATVSLPSLAKPLRIRHASIRFEEDRAVLEKLAASLGSSNLQGTIQVSRFASPQVEFSADVDQLDVAEWQQLGAGSAPGRPEPAAPAPASTSALAKVTGKGRLNVSKIVHGGIVLNQVRSECSLDHGVIRLDPLTAELFGGRQTGAIVVDTRPANASYALTTKFESVDANQLLSSTTSLKQMLFGLVFADADLRLSPRPGEEIVRSLQGTFNLRLNEGKLAGVNLLNELAQLGRFLGYSNRSETYTNIVRLTGGMRIGEGVASTDDLKLEFEGGSLAAAGAIGLADQALKLRTTAVIAKGFADRFGGNKVGGYMTTVLANPQGELIIPCLVGGSLGKPRFSPDGEQFARLKLQNLLPSAGNPAGGILGAVEAGKKSGAKGVLDALAGKPSQKESEQSAAQPPGAQPPAAEAAKPEEPKSRQPGDLLRDLFKSRKKKEP